MREFIALQSELQGVLSKAVHDFFEAKGLAFDATAWRQESCLAPEDITREILMHGAQVFPKSVIEADRAHTEDDA